MALGGLYRKLERNLVTLHSLRVGASPAGPLIQADSTRVKVPGLTLGSTALTATAAELNAVVGITGYPVQVQRRSFTEAGAGTYTGSVTVPATAVITNVRVWSSVLWAAATSALMDVGDVTDPD